MADPTLLSSPAANPLARARGQRRRLLVRALPVGLLAGLVAIGFQMGLRWIEQGRHRFLAYTGPLEGWGWLPAMVLGALCTGVGVWLVQALVPDAAGSGIPQLKAVLHFNRPMHALRLIGVKFVGGLLAIGGGLALGREGPTVQMGGAVGQLFSDLTDSHPEDRRLIISAGAGAGLTAAFNAPLAGLLFVLEELHGFISPPLLFAVFIATVTADVLARSVFGQLSVFHVPMPLLPPLSAVPWAILLGGLAGLVGVCFNRALLLTHRRMARWRGGPWSLSGWLVGALLGLVGWFLPEAVGTGARLTEQTLAAALTGGEALQYLVIRFVLTLLSYGSGAAGGLFAPLLLLGALLGLGSASVLQLWLPPVGAESQPLVGAAILGMGALFTATVRAPLTGIVIILEMTGGFELLLLLMVACLTAYTVAEALQEPPIYEALLRQQWTPLQDQDPGRASRSTPAPE